MNVTVFGSSQPRPGDPAYQEAYLLGQLLGTAGHTVLTGGYIGTMEAVSRGAAEAGGHVVGVTCQEIETWRPIRANPWVLEERRFDRLRERIFTLIEACDVAMALPGGVGTLAEISLMWNLLIIGAAPPRPLIVIGSSWRSTFDQFIQSFGPYIPERDHKWLIFVEDIEKAYSKITSLNQ